MASALVKRYGKGADSDATDTMVVANTLKAQNGRGWAHDAEATYVAATLSSGGHPNSNMPGRRKEDDVNLVAYPLARRGREGGSELEVGEANVYNALRAGDGGSSRLNQVLTPEATVRRLTPTECERLQALPDGWTNPDGNAPDSRRYAGLGDAVTASVGEWIGRRIIACA